jgi:hypothetical protein
MRKLLALSLVLMLSLTAIAAIAADTDPAETEAPKVPKIVEFVYEQGGFPDETYSFNVYSEEGVNFLSGYAYNGVQMDATAHVEDGVYDELAELVAQFDLQAWNGLGVAEDEQEDAEEVLDGHMFTLIVDYEDGTSIYAVGRQEQEYPENYEEANEALMKYFTEKIAALEDAGEVVDEESEGMDDEGLEY